MIKENSSSNKKEKATLTVLGCRGSLPVSGQNFVRYGGGTSSYLYMTDTEAIVLDAGTGILNLPDVGDRRLSLLITHSHIDHILGLPSFLGFVGKRDLSIYGATNCHMTIRQKLDTYMRKPLWPVGIDIFPAKMEFVEVKEDGVPFYIGPVKVTAVPANHPGGSTLFKLEYEGSSVVYATDFEHEELPLDRWPEMEEDAPMGEEILRYYKDPMNSLISFAKDADLVLYDGQYTPEEYEKCRTFGHSTYEKGLELMDRSGAGEVLLVHHAPNHTDEFIDNMAKELPEGRNIRFAKEAECIKMM
jgi:phosphoribosyl 1,2-cyclic phosphodiesterase